MRNTQILNQGWLFCKGKEVLTELQRTEHYNQVEVPHNAVDIPLNYFDETLLHQDFTYHYPLHCDEASLHSQQVMHFEGVMCDAHVYVNGALVKQHSDGYTPFDVNLTPFLKSGSNLITVTLSGKENPAIPPFGGMIDYLCFPGIYRDVTLTSYNAVRVKNVKIETHEVLSAPAVSIAVYLQQFAAFDAPLTLDIQLIDPEGEIIATQRISGIMDTDAPINISFGDLSQVKLWDTDNPNLYQIAIALSANAINDRYQTRFGFREAEFRVEGFYLNGQRLQLVGANRHQSYPYIGYAMGKRGQQLDAELLKNTSGFNLVRTSHYPQSPAFLERCDELGLLVFEEIAGWQHIGDESWQQKSLDNVRAMLERDWNHPSIILWGVRINESADNHNFYIETNRLARELDGTRQTGGARCIQDSEYLEDVYTMNDFILSDSLLNPRGDINLRHPQNVTGLNKLVPYLVTEYAGHMYPTKRIDCEVWQNEHVMRHLRVLNDSYANANISGAITWCLFDYNTHRDFGSGDKICYHGINDAFRVPKFAAYVYASQQKPEVEAILKPVTYWARGERPEAQVLPLVILTNCDRVEVQLSAGQSKSFYPDRTRFPHLPYPPVVIDQTNQGDLPVGGWGHTWSDLTLRGYTGDEMIIETELSASPEPTTMDVQVQTRILNAHCGDASRIVIKALDQKQQLLPYFRDVITLETSSNLQVMGPEMLSFEGGVASFWVRAYEPGSGYIRLTSQVFGNDQIDMEVISASSALNSTSEVPHG